MKGQIRSLNGLRAVSILLVIGYHLKQHNFLSNGILLKYVGFIIFNGQVGVNFFFVISGFLITTLLIKEQNNFGALNLPKFYIRRILRIFPAYYFLALVYLVLSIKNYFHINLVEWVSILSYSKQFVFSYVNEINHLWSLSVEELFYLLWPIIFIVSKRYCSTIISLLIVIIVLIRAFSYDYPQPTNSNTILSTGDALLIGCLFAIKHESILNWITKKKRYFFLIPGLIISILSYNYTYHLGSTVSVNVNYYINKILNPLTYSLLGNIGLITNLLIGLIVIVSINIKNRWTNILNNTVVNQLGKLSYSIYLWQQLFTSDRPYLHKIPIIFLLLIIYFLAIFSYYLIEKPFFSLKERFARS